MNLADQPAFPRPYSEFYQDSRPKDAMPQSGMTLRQYYAGLAMQGMMARSGTEALKDRAGRAVRIADALIAELSKPTGGTV